ncbi:MAG: polyketide cyclase, partial [Marmoricola sp.]|nr:polyketide cyclase [Marmoricola sp.]
FCFDVRRIGLGTPRLPGRIARWDYVLEPVDGGTRVTETWTDGRRHWPDPVAGLFDRVVTGGQPFSEFQRRNIARTLAALKADLEQASGPAGDR